MSIKLKDILCGKYDLEIAQPLTKTSDVIRDEPQTHTLLLPLVVPSERWEELQLLFGNSTDEARDQLKTVLIEILNKME